MAPDDWESIVEAAVASSQLELPTEVSERALAIIADTVGVVIAGARQPEIERIADALESTGASAGARILTAPPRHATAEAAAFVNATAGAWLELDEAAGTGVHAGVHVLAPVLAIAQARRHSGERLLRGFIAGYEVTAALYERFALTYPVHPHAGLAGVGAAVGLAVTAGRDPIQTARIAGTLPIIPTWDACYDGSTARHAFSGSAAAAAVRSLLLAEAGFSGSSSALPTLFGAIVGQPAGPAHHPSDVAHHEFHLMRNSFKFHSACLTCHSAIDAALDLGYLDPAEILSLRIETSHAVVEKVGRLPNDTSLSRRFSLAYTVATAIMNQSANPSSFSHDDDVYRLAERAEVVTDTTMPQGTHDFPAKVTVTTSNATLSAMVVHPRGHPSRTPAMGELRDKFASLVGSSELFDRLLNLRSVADCQTLRVT